MDDLSNVRGLERAFLRRLTQNDESAAVLAEELLEEVVGDQVEWQYAVIRGHKATELWPRVRNAEAATDMPFPKTLLVLWSAVVEGWLASENLEDEHALARFIASTKLIGEGKAHEPMFSKLRRGLDSLAQMDAFGKVMRFLQPIDFEHDNEEIVWVISKMLGRYTPTTHSSFAAHVLSSLRVKDGNMWGVSNFIDALQITAPFVAKATEQALQTAYDATRILKELNLQPGPLKLGARIKLVTETSIEFVWRKPDEHAGSPEEKINNKKFLEVQADRIREWYKDTASVLAIESITLVVDASKPDVGNSVTKVEV